MKSDSKKTFITIITNSITSIVTIIVSLISTILVTRILSTSDIGIATAFSSLRNIATIICLLAIYISINRLLLDFENTEIKFLSSIYIFSSLFCIFSFIIYIIFRNQLNYLLGFDTKMIILLFSIIFFSNASTIMNNYWNYKASYKKLLLFNILSSPVAQIASIILPLLLVNNRYLGRIIGVEIFNVMIGIICGVYILKKGKFYFNIKHVKKALKISIPMIPHLLSQILLTSCDLLMIKSLVSNSAAGIYSMAYTVANIFYLIMIQIFMPWSPWVYRRIKNNDIKSIYNYSKYLIIVTAYLAFGLFTVAPEMIRIFLPSNYSSSIILVAPICVGIFFEIMCLFFYDIEYYHKKNKQISIFSVVAAILNIILNYFCIKYIGFEAAAFTTLISYFVLLLMHYIGMKKTDNRSFYNIKFLCFISFSLLTISMLYYISNNNIYIRYLFLIVISILIFIKYKCEVINMIKNIKKEEGQVDII